MGFKTHDTFLLGDRLKEKMKELIKVSELEKLTDEKLIHETTHAIRLERNSTAIVVKYFHEIYVRKLYLLRGYPSLFEMATQYFGYCAGAAQRRINSMKLVTELPEVEEQIESGALSLTAASTLLGFFASEKKDNKFYSKTEKLALVQVCLNNSTREIERKLVAISPDREKRETLTYTSEHRLRLSISISEELNLKLNRLKDVWSHSNLTTEQVLEKIADLALDRVDPIRIHARILEKKRMS